MYLQGILSITRMGAFIDDFSTTVLAWLTFVLDLLIASFQGVVPIFWETVTGFTIYGMLLLFALAVSFVSFAMAFIIRLIRK